MASTRFDMDINLNSQDSRYLSDKASKLPTLQDPTHSARLKLRPIPATDLTQIEMDGWQTETAYGETRARQFVKVHATPKELFKLGWACLQCAMHKTFNR